MESIDKKKIAIIVKENLTKLVKMYKRTDREESRKEKLSHELIVSAVE